jgi:hypothetical protein
MLRFAKGSEGFVEKRDANGAEILTAYFEP